MTLREDERQIRDKVVGMIGTEMRDTGVTDHKGKRIYLNNTVRWMASCGDCFKGVIDFRENIDDSTPFLSGFLATKIVNITDDVMDDEGNLKDGWNGELEVISEREEEK